MTSDNIDKIDALVLHGPKDLRLEKRPVPQPAPGEVQVSIQATGLCGSDLHYYNHGRNGNFVLQHPMCLGHEAAGMVTAVPTHPPINGTGNTATKTSTSRLKVGDRVALEVGIPCRQCHLCTTGRYNLCPRLQFRSSAKTYPHLDGTLQTSITHVEALCHKLPDHVTYEEGALVEPLAVSLHAINRSVSSGSNTSTPLTGSSALVLGAGAVGILTAVALSVSGVSTVLICDIDASRLEVASKMAGDRFKLKTFLLPKPKPNSNPSSTPGTLPSSIEDQHAACQAQATELIKYANLASSSSSDDDNFQIGFDRTFECTGLPSCVTTSIHATNPGGKIILVGMGNPLQTQPLGAAALREIDIVGVFRYAATCYPAAIQMFASGQLDGVAEAVVSHRVKLRNDDNNKNVDLAFRIASNAATESEMQGRPAVKVMVVP